ncbi:hypothetical protein Sya03_40230 [Spirilliplanes yamanashiensis]|uniref:Secreted protein n=2 Tax=Spirilliplanes yamanashiensis TaxID=42233 RepID=A0A8J3Y9T7_9ACTN|nr:hypothetical protein Sya03_40230 [Spirilliplanes yamanashiensis]
MNSRNAKMRRHFGRAFASGVVIAASLTVPATPAFADGETCWKGRIDCEASTIITNNNTRIFACDREADGRGARAWYIDNHNVHRYVSDANGSRGVCSYYKEVPPGDRITAYRMCLVRGTTEDCENWNRIS